MSDIFAEHKNRLTELIAKIARSQRRRNGQLTILSAEGAGF